MKADMEVLQSAAETAKGTETAEQQPPEDIVHLHINLQVCLLQSCRPADLASGAAFRPRLKASCGISQETTQNEERLQSKVAEQVEVIERHQAELQAKDDHIKKLCASTVSDIVLLLTLEPTTCAAQEHSFQDV